MNPHHTPPQTPRLEPRQDSPLVARAMQRQHDWERLRDLLQALHAELEYLRLMLKVNPPA